MPLRITNVAFPERRADLPGGLPDQYIIGYSVNAGANQQWNIPNLNPLAGTTLIQSVIAAPPIGPIGARNNVENPDVPKTIFAGGPNNLFAINVLGIVVVDGALTNIVTIRLGDLDLFWTLGSNELSEQIRLRPLRTLENDAQAQINQQLWTLSAV